MKQRVYIDMDIFLIAHLKKTNGVITKQITDRLQARQGIKWFPYHPPPETNKLIDDICFALAVFHR